MASPKNDAVSGKNFYDSQRCCGTSTDKGLAARLGGHNYNILSNQDRDEMYFPDMRHDDHYLDKKGRHTVHMFGDRRRKFGVDERNLVGKSLRAPDCHPREGAVQQRRQEVQLAQMENPQSFNEFQQRCQATFFPGPPPKRYSVHNRLYANEVGKLREKNVGKDEWQRRRGETMTRMISAPSVLLSDPVGSLEHAVRSDARKEATQRQTESAHFAPWHAANTLSASIDSTDAGRRLAATQGLCSVNRLENHDFAVSRKNNHFSSQDKLTRSDPFFMRPRHSISNNSVKYDIISNERRWFRY